MSCGYADEAAAWRHWLLRAVGGDPDELQVLYTVDGARRIPEQELDWLSGFAGSTPVRVGNSAASQFQIDIFGEVLDTLELARIAGITEHPEREDPTEAVDSAWRVQRLLCESVGRRWEQPDAALLLLGRVGFLPWDDPRIRATVRAVQETLSDDQGFVRRPLPRQRGRRGGRSARNRGLVSGVLVLDGRCPRRHRRTSGGRKAVQQTARCDQRRRADRRGGRPGDRLYACGAIFHRRTAMSA